MSEPLAVRVLALGGIRSGKSAWAEATIAAAHTDVRYVATAPRDGDPAWAARVAGHRDRRPPNWTTVETVDVVTELTTSQVPTLVDDMGGWLVSAMDRAHSWTGGSVRRDVDAIVDAVESFTAPLVLVSPEVGLSVVPATNSGGLFADALGELNQRLASVCDRVVLVVAGRALTLEEPT